MDDMDSSTALEEWVETGIGCEAYSYNLTDPRAAFLQRILDAAWAQEPHITFLRVVKGARDLTKAVESGHERMIEVVDGIQQASEHLMELIHQHYIRPARMAQDAAFNGRGH